MFRWDRAALSAKLRALPSTPTRQFRWDRAALSAKLRVMDDGLAVKFRWDRAALSAKLWNRSFMMPLTFRWDRAALSAKLQPAVGSFTQTFRWDRAALSAKLGLPYLSDVAGFFGDLVAKNRREPGQNNTNWSGFAGVAAADSPRKLLISSYCLSVKNSKSTLPSCGTTFPTRVARASHFSLLGQ